MSEPVIRFDGVSKSFGKVEAVRRAHFSLRRSALTAFLGENGAGKTTCLKMILGFLKPDAGSLDVSRDRIGYVPEHPVFFPRLKGREILELTARLGAVPGESYPDRVRRYSGALNFDPGLLERPARTYSLGNHKKFSYLQSLLLDPEVLVVDEPFTSLDPVAIKGVRDLFLDLKRAGKTLLLSSHLLSEMERISDDIIIIRRGEIVFRGELRGVLDKGKSLELMFLELAR